MAKHLHTAQSERSELCESVCRVYLCIDANVSYNPVFMKRVSSPKLQNDLWLLAVKKPS